MTYIESQVGPRTLADGAPAPARSTKTGDLAVSDAHGRFQEAALRGKLFSDGMTLTSISNATFSTGTLGATATPVLGVWNPANSGYNLVILQARLQIVNTALQVTGPGAFMWATSYSNGAITTGNSPLNRATLQAVGSVAKGFAGVALTGLTNNLVVREASGLADGPMSNLSTLQTAVGLMPTHAPSVDNIDGAFIVPPGGVLALLTSTNAPVAISAASSLLWEEVAV
jgi:hypothetical protein